MLQANLKLGLRRAAAVCAYLRGHGVAAKLSVASRGERQPVDTNTTARGRSHNRRVELAAIR